MSLEQKIQKSILDYINRQPKSVAFKVIRANEGGVPDIAASVNGHPVWIEVKKPGEEPTKLQYAQMDRLAKAGSFVRWASSVKDAADWLERTGLIRK